MILLSLLFAYQSNATTLLVVTDQPKAAKAQEVATLFRTTEPYSLMKDLKVKVIQTSAAKLGCNAAAASASDIIASDKDAWNDDLLAKSEWRDRATHGLMLPPSCNDKETPISRLISCDTPQANAYLGALAKTEHTKFALIVKTDARYGGSGGTYPVITTGSPATMAVHELMHQLGFADEYSYYNACEADIYCDDSGGDYTSASGYGSLPGTSFNVAMFNARSSYASSQEARNDHAKQIPWLAQIDAKTPITTNGKLGTAPASNETGLFKTIVCDRASKRLDTWSPTTDTTIMRTLATTHIPKDYWPTIAKSLGTHITP